MPTTSLSTLLSGTTSANLPGCLPGLLQGPGGAAVGAEPGAVFTSLPQLRARLWDCGETLEITYSLFQCSISWDLASLPFTGPSLLFLSLIPLKYATDHFALVL